MKLSDCGLVSFGFLDVANDHISVFFDGENNDQWRQMHGGSGNRISTAYPIRCNNPKCERIAIKSIDHRENTSAVKVVLGPQKPRNPKLQAKPNTHNKMWLSV